MPAASNLIDNALQHTPRGTCVCVEWGSDAGRPWLQVRDDGAHSCRAASRAHATERLGLGYKIIERVMDTHGGSFGQHSAAPLFTRCYRLCFAAHS